MRWATPSLKGDDRLSPDDSVFRDVSQARRSGAPSRPAGGGYAPPVVGTPVTVSFTPKSKDLARVGYGVVARSPARFAALVVILVALAVLGGVFGGGTAWSFIFAILFVGVGLTSVAVGSCIRPRSRSTRTMIFSEDGVTIKTPKSEVRRNWSSFNELYVDSRGYVLTVTRSRAFYYIPRSAFASPANEQLFRELLDMHSPAFASRG